MPACTVADDDDLGTDAFHVILNVAQLRELLAAEDSAEVADEEEQRRPSTQDLGQVPDLALCVLKLDSSKIASEQIDLPGSRAFAGGPRTLSNCSSPEWRHRMRGCKDMAPGAAAAPRGYGATILAAVA